MGYVVRMPQLGMTMETGIVVDWPVDTGDLVGAGEVIAVVESEKTTNEVEAREDGVILERFVEPEQAVPPGYPIAYVGDAGAEVPEAVLAELEAEGTPERAAPSTSASVATAPARGEPSTDRRVSPRARSYAAANDIALDPLIDRVEGTGPEGAITERDLVEAVEAGVADTAPAVAPERAIYEERTGSQLRKTIADRMTASAREAPQVTLNRRVPVDALLDVKARLETDLDRDVSLSDFVVAAVVEALEAHPAFNAIYEDGVHKLAANVNVGIAVDIEGGLVTPVLREANRLSLTEIGRERSLLVARVRSGDYTNDDFAGGTFTVSNLGHFGVESFDPLLNPPEVALLGVGTITSVYDPETGTAARRLGLSLTFDHRAVDGADAARFLEAIADALAHPLRLASLPAVPTDRVEFGRVDGDADAARTARATYEGGLLASVRSGGFEWTADEPARYGGDDTAPSPVDQFLGSLASCLALTISMVAGRRDVPLDDIEVTVDATPAEGRIERLDTVVSVTAAADQDDVERVVGTAERACYVNDLVREDVDRRLTIEIRPGE